MFTRFTKDRDFDLYINAALKLKLNYKILFDEIPIGYINKNSKKLLILQNRIGINNTATRGITSNKYYAYKFLDLRGFPHPKGILIHSEAAKNIQKFIKTIFPPPWVVKPLTESCGHGVTVEIRDKKQLVEAIEGARKYSATILIEEFMKGEDYRIIVLNNKVIDIVRRDRSTLTGDGIHTIKELISEKNKFRSNLDLSTIDINDATIKELTKYGYSLRATPKDGERIILYKQGNLHCEETHRIKLSEVHKDNIKLFVDCVRFFGATLAGIDFITPDITKSHKEIKCGINEINSSPMTIINYSADMKMDNFVAEKILKFYFGLK